MDRYSQACARGNASTSFESVFNYTKLLNALERRVPVHHSKISTSSNGRSRFMDRSRLWTCKTLTASFVLAMISSFATLMGAGILFINSTMMSSLNYRPECQILLNAAVRFVTGHTTAVMTWPNQSHKLCCAPISAPDPCSWVLAVHMDGCWMIKCETSH